MFVGCYGAMDVMAFFCTTFFGTDCSCNITEGNVGFIGFVKSPKNEVCRLFIIICEGKLVVFPPSYQYYNPFSTNVCSENISKRNLYMI